MLPGRRPGRPQQQYRKKPRTKTPTTAPIVTPAIALFDKPLPLPLPAKAGGVEVAGVEGLVMEGLEGFVGVPI